MPNREKTYKIAEFSKKTDLPTSTLRYYEELGLLNPQRLSNNYRSYSQQDLNWCQFIQRAKSTGMPLSTIIEYSQLRQRGEETINDRIRILEQQEQILLIEQKKIQSHLDFLQNKKKHYLSNKLNNKGDTIT
jgi:Predicted transcriptional regulators